jgi:hypothetical protein
VQERSGGFGPFEQLGADAEVAVLRMNAALVSHLVDGLCRGTAERIIQVPGEPVVAVAVAVATAQARAQTKAAVAVVVARAA